MTNPEPDDSFLFARDGHAYTHERKARASGATLTHPTPSLGPLTDWTGGSSVSLRHSGRCGPDFFLVSPVSCLLSCRRRNGEGVSKPGKRDGE